MVQYLEEKTHCYYFVSVEPAWFLESMRGLLSWRETAGHTVSCDTLKVTTYPTATRNLRSQLYNQFQINVLQI